jgi:hypothetical protein
MASTDFDLKAKEAIPAEVHMISGSHDIQTSADVSNVGAFQVSSVVSAILSIRQMCCDSDTYLVSSTW